MFRVLRGKLVLDRRRSCGGGGGHIYNETQENTKSGSDILRFFDLQETWFLVIRIRRDRERMDNKIRMCVVSFCDYFERGGVHWALLCASMCAFGIQMGCVCSLQEIQKKSWTCSRGELCTVKSGIPWNREWGARIWGFSGLDIGARCFSVHLHFDGGSVRGGRGRR